MNIELSIELASRLGWAVIHSLWQGALVVAILASALVLLRKHSAAARHTACVLALAAMIAGFGFTFMRSGSQLAPVGSPPAVPASPPRSTAIAIPNLEEQREESRPALLSLETLRAPDEAAGAVGMTRRPIKAWADRLAIYAPRVGTLWIIGTALLSVWRIGGCWRVRLLRRRGVVAGSSDAQSAVVQIANRLGLRTAVRVLESSRAAVPMLTGFFRPVILLPARHVTGLTPRELEALLAHELAHFARGDLWTNLFLLCAETLFFYQPAAWWITGRARCEREHAADDLALRVCEGAVYASALARLAELDLPPAPALAASGGSLLERIRRILGEPPRAESPTGLWAGAVTLLSATLIFSQVLSANAADEGKTIVVAPGESIQQAIDRAPADAVIRLGEGEWRERIVISKPLTLEGAGWEKTRITIEEPTAENMAKAGTELETRRRAATTREEQDQIDTEWIRRVRSPAIWVDRTQDVKLQKLRVQGLSQRGAADGGTSSVLVYFRKAKAAMSECALVGPFGNGIYLAGGSDVVISRSLVAALWGEGIYVAGRGRDELDLKSRLHLIDSEVRNVYHYGIAIARGCNDTVIERCRISGTAWHGIRYDDASPTITGNTIFGHARFGIYASGSTHATVTGNLLWKNEMEGMWCLYDNTDVIEGNTFVGNVRGGLAVSGGAKPRVTRNLFAIHPIAVSCSSLSGRGGQTTPPGDPVLTANLFWDNQNVLQIGADVKPAPDGSLAVDPQFRDVAKLDFALTARSPAKAANIGVPEPLPLASPWPLLAEEKAIIPQGNTRDSRSWTGPGDKGKAAAPKGAEKAGSAVKPGIVPGESIQDAIDRAPAGAVIRLGEGEWKERITISKPLTLEGAGWEKTILKPDQLPPGVTAESKAQFRDRYARGLSDAERAALEREWAEKFARPTLLVRGTPKVIIRKLRVGGVAPPSEQPAGGEALVVFRKAQAVMSECAVVGPFEDGIQISGNSDVEVMRSFVAALRGEGINVEGRDTGADRPSRLHLVESEVRTVADGVHIGGDCDTTVIEGCRISGARQKGIHYEYASPRITGNVILKNGGGIYAHGKTRAIVRANLFWKNEGAGMSCWFENADTIEGNTFVENVREALFVMGSSKPAVTRNIFSDSPVGISCGMVGPQIGEPVLTGNLFWQTAIVLDAMGKKPAPDGSLTADPQFQDPGNADFTLVAASAARQANIGFADPLTPASPWPFLPEEKAIVAPAKTISVTREAGAEPRLEILGLRQRVFFARETGFEWVASPSVLESVSRWVPFEGFRTSRNPGSHTSINALDLPKP